MNIPGVGVFGYILDSIETKMQFIPTDTKIDAVLDAVIVPEKGPYGTADDIYYLFKKKPH